MDNNNKSKFLDNKKSNPFVTPENYFEELPSKIISKCEKEHHIKSFPISKTYMAYAASIFILITVSIFIMYVSKTTFITKNEIAIADAHDSNGVKNSNIANDTSDNQLIAENIISEPNKFEDDAIIDYLLYDIESYEEIIELFEY